MNNKVKFMNDITLEAKVTGDVLIERRDGKHSFIKDVFHIPRIKYNLISIGQLLEMSYNIHMPGAMRYRRTHIFGLKESYE